ncbi:MAG: 4Fe-4S ferredoxin, partial [Cyclobacteriaceae bacterium]
MHLIQKIGITLFILSCAGTIAILFVNSYRLNENAIRNAVDNETEQEQLIGTLSPLFGKSYPVSFSFQKAYTDLLKGENERIRNDYSIEETTVTAYLDKLDDDLTYNSAAWEDIFPEGEVGSYQREQFKAYTSWMDGRQYDSRKALREQLNKTRTDINSDIVASKGYGGDRLKSLKLALNRHASYGPLQEHRALWLLLTIGLGIAGALLYILPKTNKLPGIKNNHIFHHPNTSRGWIGIIVGILLILFYIVLYWFPEHMTGWMILADPLSHSL